MQTRTLLPRALNGRAEDLVLLAKEHYTKVNIHGLRRAEMARRIVAFHNLHTIERMTLEVTADVLMTELWPIVGPQLVSPYQAREFIKALAPDPLRPLVGPHPDGFYGQLIDRLLGIVAMTRMRDDTGNWLLPVKLAQPDPAIVALLECEDTTSYAYVRSPAAVEA